MLMIFMSSSGLSCRFVRTFSILWITSSPCVARPNMVCLPSSHGYNNNPAVQLLSRGHTPTPGAEKKKGRRETHTVLSVVIKN